MSLFEEFTLWLSRLVLTQICAPRATAGLPPPLPPASPAAGWVQYVTRFWPTGCERSDERQVEVVKRGGWVFSPVPCPLEDDAYDLKGEVAQDKKRLGP